VEVHVLQLYPALHRRRAEPILRRHVDGRHPVDNPVDLGSRELAGAEGLEGGADLADAEGAHNDGEEDHHHIATRENLTSSRVLDLVHDEPPSKPEPNRVGAHKRGKHHAEAEALDLSCLNALSKSADELC